MRLLSLLIFGLLAALPARAETYEEPATMLTALGQVPADPAWWGDSRIVDVVDLAALRQVSGIGPAITFADFAAHRLSENDELAVTSLLRRLQSSASFLQYLLTGAEAWPELIGVDFLALDWFTEPSVPPRMLLILGGSAVPKGEGLQVLGKAGLAPVQHGGTTVWAKGDGDYQIDVRNRDPRLPFWGWLGSAVRAFRGEHALVGARAWSDLDLALAVERNEANSLADLPRYRLAVEAAGDPDAAAGPILQMTFVDGTMKEGASAPDPEGLPPYDLLAFADREDAAGQELVLVLSYGTDAETAAAVASMLPEKIASQRDKGGASIADRFPGLAVRAMPLETDNGAAAVAVLSIPPLPVKNAEGKVQNRSLLYTYFLRMLWNREMTFLAVKSW